MTRRSKLLRATDLDLVRDMAGPRPWSRGRDYAHPGIVEWNHRQTDRVLATVHGTAAYAVSVWLDGSTSFGYSCSCPMGEQELCKHVVAVVLLLHQEAGASLDEASFFDEDDEADGWDDRDDDWDDDESGWDEPDDDDEAAGIEAGAAHEPHPAGWCPDDDDPLTPFLRSIDQHTLVDIVLDAARNDPYLRAVLSEGARRWSGEEATVPGDVEDVDEAEDVDGAGEPAFTDVAASSDAVAVTRLAGLDSDEDQVVFAADVFHAWTEDPDGGMEEPLSRLGPLFSEVGLAEYARLLDDRRQLLPRTPDPAWAHEQGRMRDAYLALARLRDDLDAEIEALRDPSLGPVDHLTVIDRLVEAGRTADAIAAARDAIATAPHESYRTTYRRRLAPLLVAEGDRAGACDALFDAFAAGPSLNAYRLLAETCEPADRASWRARVEDELSAQLAAERRGRRRYSFEGPPLGTVLTQVLVHDEQFDEAWAAAFEHGCTTSVGLALAERDGLRRPDRAIELYRRTIDELAEQKRKHTYEEAVELVPRVQACCAALGEPDAFPQFLAALRKRHKAKRTFMTLLSAAGCD